MKTKTLKPFILGIALGAGMVATFVGGAVVDRIEGIKMLDRLVKRTETGVEFPELKREIVDEESVVTKVVERVTPGVVTVSMSKTRTINLSPFDGFGLFGDFFGFPGLPGRQREEKVEQDIGTGFVISNDGLIVTNRHVVSDTQAKYKVVIGKDDVVEVKEIYRDPDPGRDLAIIKIDRKNLTPIPLGDSDKLKVGQTVIAIGTALGEFRSTVTKGVISGLGRGIVAGSPFEGNEKLDNVIQTDAAINPGNSGGPLLNSSGEVIGVNVAVSQSGQNIGFALPINIVKESINNFKTTGEFERPFLGVSYSMISKQAALLNEVPMGAYVREVIEGSPAEKGGVKADDIIIEFDGQRLNEDTKDSLSAMINKKKIGDKVKVRVWREEKELSLEVVLEKRKQEQE